MINPDRSMASPDHIGSSPSKADLSRKPDVVPPVPADFTLMHYSERGGLFGTSSIESDAMGLPGVEVTDIQGEINE